VALVQLIHRALAVATLAAVIGWRIAAASILTTPRRRLAANLLAAAVLVQVALGISTLVLYMPIALAAWHQANGVLVWALALWVLFETRPAPRGLPAAVDGSDLAGRVSRPA
jgi:cytochrome c oxidase assembly protein subunit 15